VYKDFGSGVSAFTDKSSIGRNKDDVVEDLMRPVNN